MPFYLHFLMAYSTLLRDWTSLSATQTNLALSGEIDDGAVSKIIWPIRTYLKKAVILHYPDAVA